MKKLLLLLLCVPLMFSCGEKEEKDNKINKLEKRVTMDLLINKGNKNGDVFYYENRLFNGIGYDVYLHGDGIYGNRGQLRREGNIKDGKRDGLWRSYYHKNGTLQEELNFKDGKKDGLWRWYNENGQLRYEGYWKDGGKYYDTFDEDGKIID